MAKKVVLAGACRTAIGTMGGSLSAVPAAELGAIVIKEALNRAGVAPEQVDQVYMGCVIQAGQGQNVARQASIKAGLPIEVPAVTMNVVCGSGLNCVNQAAQMIMAGDADIVVAGGKGESVRTVLGKLIAACILHNRTVLGENDNCFVRPLEFNRAVGVSVIVHAYESSFGIRLHVVKLCGDGINAGAEFIGY